MKLKPRQNKRKAKNLKVGAPHVTLPMKNAKELGRK